MSFIVGLLLGGLIVGYFLHRVVIDNRILRDQLDEAERVAERQMAERKDLASRLRTTQRLRHVAEIRRRVAVGLLEHEQAEHAATKAELEWARVIIAVQMADADLRPVILAEHRKKGAGNATRSARRVS